MVEGVTYTQEIDEKTGAIKYVPSNPPTPPPSDSENDGKDGSNGDGKNAGGKGGGQGDGESDGTFAPTGKHGGEPSYAHDSDANEYFADMINHVEFSANDKMAELLKRLEDNNKRLRYDTRIENGKLDGRRLTAYKTSSKLFKKKAIKHKNYQFTIMLDTSGSMFGDENDRTDEANHHKTSKINIGVSSIAQTVKALEELNLPVAVVAMNYKVDLLKAYGEKWNENKFCDTLQRNMVGKAKSGMDPMGGTDESVAYDETLKYISEHSDQKTNNIVIVLSDGEPNSSGGQVDCTFEGEMYQIQSRPSHTDSLRKYWEQQTLVVPYGIGLLSGARQLPRSQRLNHIDKLPELMSNLIQEILL